MTLSLPTLRAAAEAAPHRFRPVLEYDDHDGLGYPVMVQDPEGVYVAHADYERVAKLARALLDRLSAAEARLSAAEGALREVIDEYEHPDHADGDWSHQVVIRICKAVLASSGAAAPTPSTTGTGEGTL